jgi:hypothetical protein
MKIVVSYNKCQIRLIVAQTKAGETVKFELVSSPPEAPTPKRNMRRGVDGVKVHDCGSLVSVWRIELPDGSYFFVVKGPGGFSATTHGTLAAALNEAKDLELRLKPSTDKDPSSNFRP